MQEKLEHIEILYKIKTKQFNDSMVELKIESIKFKDLLEKEKQTNSKLLSARINEIGKLKEENIKLRQEVNNLQLNNSVLRSTLGHF